MNRLTRIFAAALVTMTMLVVTAPAAQARPLAKPQSVQTLSGDWLGAALSWLNQLLVRQTPQNTREKASTAPTDSNTTSGGGFTGSCIDPDGCIIVERGNGGK
jgi:hypothetical protein